ADFKAGSEPARLNMVDVVEIEPADGERFQVIDGGGFLDFLAERCVVGSKNPRDERCEAAGIFLDPPDAIEVIDAMAKLFAVAEHHGGGGAQAELVRGAMHHLPIITGAFEARDLATNFVIENFRTTARDGSEAGIHQAANGVFDGEFADFGDAENF